MKEQKDIFKATRVLSLSILLSRIFGYIRDYTIAYFFGASTGTDAFFVAYQIPNLFRRLFGEGTLSSAAVPLLTEREQKYGRAETVRYTNIILTNLLFVILIFTILGIVFAREFVFIQAPGFIADKGKFQLTVNLLRITFPYLIFIILCAWAMGYLNTLKVFSIPALSSVIFNIFIILAILIFYKIIGLKTVAILSYSVLIAVVIQFLFHLPKMYATGYKFAFLGLFSKEILPLLRLMLPAFISLAVFQINILIDRVIASFLPSGSISYLYYSNRLMQLPLGIFGISYSIAALPTFSSLNLSNQKDKIRHSINIGFKFISLIMLPVMIIYFFLGMDIVDFLFGHGKFKQLNATLPTYSALIFYSLGLPAYAQLKLLNSYFYAKKDIRIPAFVGIASMAVNVILNLILIRYFQHAGLALATAMAGNFSLFALLHYTTKDIGTIIDKTYIKYFLNVLLISFVSSALTYIVKYKLNLHIVLLLLLNGVLFFALLRLSGNRDLENFFLGKTKKSA